MDGNDMRIDPIFRRGKETGGFGGQSPGTRVLPVDGGKGDAEAGGADQVDLVCRLLLEKKKKSSNS